MAVRKLDDEVIQFLGQTFYKLQLVGRGRKTASFKVEVFNDKCQKELDGRYQREFRDRVGDQQQGFKQKWEALVEEKKRFLKEYEFEMLRRQPAEVSRQPSTVAQPPPTLQEKIWPPMPVTDPNVIQGQHKQLNQLDKTMKESISCPSRSGSCWLEIRWKDRLERYMAEITWSSIVLAFGMMPTAQQEILRNSSIEVCIFKKAEFKLYEQKLKEKKNLLDSSMANKLKLTETFGAVPDKGGFDWVRTKNMPTDRLERLACFTRTAHALAAQGFTSQAGEVKLELQPTISGTEVVRASAFNGTGSGRKLLHHENLTVMEVALKTQSSGKMTMAVNAASAYQVGGGVMSGGRHALEETWCTMSTLLPSLQKVQWQDRRDTSHAPPGGHHLHQHIPVDACVLSPAIQVFRDTSAKGYRFQERPVTLTGVCSMAMFNMNSRVADSPLDAPREFTEYCKQVKDKFKAAMACMLKLKATVLVCPDVGCGVFENDPEVMGCLLGEVVLDYPGDLEVIATGKPAFFDALRKTVEADPKLPLRATGAAPASFEKLKAAPPKAAPPKAAPYAPKAKAKSAPGTSAPSGASASGPPLVRASRTAPSAPKAKACLKHSIALHM
ncbi:DUF2263 domain-containing protein [Durusdinium trenchii]|uniref:DUF2263 domain-containing protein n=1 Tax=Durusdinium trenchii TaxID=1381693 RepID=A0ABP0PUS7_9DINO